MITAIVLTKNEEEKLDKCLSSLSFCDEIIVLDDHSTDNTRIIARKHKTKLLIRSLDNDFATHRNFALSHASHKWVLFVDADEVVDKNLSDEMIKSVREDKYDAFFLKRRDVLWGRTLYYGESGNIKLVRLAKKDAGVWKRKVHEKWIIDGKIGELENPLLHFPHSDLFGFTNSINQYSKIHAYENLAEGKKSSLLMIMFAPVGKFLENYFLKQGFRDGTPGCVAALMLSFHSFLAWSTLWLIQQEK